MTVATRGITITPTIELVTEDCIECGVTFAMPGELRRELTRSHRWFYCPNGHRMHYNGESDAEREKKRADRLARQLEAAQARATHEADQRRAAERSNRALKAVNTRTRKRIAAGLCPCCRRHFGNLADHMAHQHPDYVHTEEGTS